MLQTMIFISYNDVTLVLKQIINYAYAECIGAAASALQTFACTCKHSGLFTLVLGNGGIVYQKAVGRLSLSTCMGVRRSGPTPSSDSEPRLCVPPAQGDGGAGRQRVSSPPLCPLLRPLTL